MVRSTDKWRELSAPEKVVYAKNQRRFAFEVRAEPRTGSDCPKLLHRSGDRSPVSGKSRAAGLTWPLPDDYDDRRLNELLFPSRPDYPRLRCRGPAWTSARFTASWRQTGSSPCNCSGKNTGRSRAAAMATAASANSTSAGTGTENVTLRQDHRAGEKTVRRLGRTQGHHSRPRHRRDRTGIVVRRRAGRQHLYLCLCGAGPASGQLDRLPRPRL